MRYELDCECGAAVTVVEAAAGTTALCRCGRAVVIPSLRELRRQAGVREPAVAPELMVESLLLAGKLPEEDHCVLCGVKTGTSICCRTECERARMVSGQPSWWVTWRHSLPLDGSERHSPRPRQGKPGSGERTASSPCP